MSFLGGMYSFLMDFQQNDQAFQTDNNVILQYDANGEQHIRRFEPEKC